MGYSWGCNSWYIQVSYNGGSPNHRSPYWNGLLIIRRYAKWLSGYWELHIIAQIPIYQPVYTMVCYQPMFHGSKEVRLVSLEQQNQAMKERKKERKKESVNTHDDHYYILLPCSLLRKCLGAQFTMIWRVKCLLRQWPGSIGTHIWEFLPIISIYPRIVLLSRMSPTCCHHIICAHI